MMKQLLLVVAILGLISAFNLQKQSTQIQALTDPTQCIKDHCPNEYNKCQADPKCPTVLQNCQNKCKTDQNCWKLCLAQAGDQPAIDVAKCAAANHCLSQQVIQVVQVSTAVVELEDPTQCIKDHCPNEYNRCQADPKCPGVLQNCQNKCKTDQNCWKLCLAQAGDQPAIDVAKCAAANHCLSGCDEQLSTALVALEDPTQCIKDHCPNEYNRCQADPKCPGVLQNCQNKCKTDQNCWKLCLAQAGDQPAIDVAKCAAANHCLSQQVIQVVSTAVAELEDPTQCIKDHCPNEYNRCQADPKCPGVLQNCQNKCKTDQNCWKLCLAQAGDQPAIDVAKCAAANHCLSQQVVQVSTAVAELEDPTQCIKDHCPNEYNRCQADPKCPGVLQNCQNKCKTDQNCWKLCLAQAGDQPAIDVAKCAAANHCLSESVIQVVQVSTAVAELEDPTQCIKDHCPNEYNRCQADPKCPGVLQNCQNKCKTDQNCWKLCLAQAGDQPAIDVAKCAAANHCLSQQVIQVVQVSTAVAELEDPTQCIKDHCPNEYNRCQADPKCPGVLQNCQNKCKTDQNCWKLCLAQAGDQPAIDVAKCAAANHCLSI